MDKYRPKRCLRRRFANSVILVTIVVASFASSAASLSRSAHPPIDWTICFTAATSDISNVWIGGRLYPEKVAENLGKSGSYIPSVRPGNETKEYINRVLSRITVLGSVALAIIAVMPHIMPLVWPDLPNSMALGGTGMIIVVGVAIETVRQVQGLITQKSYKKYYED